MKLWRVVVVSRFHSVVCRVCCVACAELKCAPSTVGEHISVGSCRGRQVSRALSLSLALPLLTSWKRCAAILWAGAVGQIAAGPLVVVSVIGPSAVQHLGVIWMVAGAVGQIAAGPLVVVSVIGPSAVQHLGVIWMVYGTHCGVD
ncbi:uncharacterized protein LOC131467514 isoform X2 [Solea solea]|uniref:uncharacterized protein LOC131467514 isoform X2 n=1 Tax=Solea solea TaxID=90069 RepID=UPI00272C0D64|nr:uncharacterized protein LOC131467514 isoform X2 [Solea solea]